MKKCPNCNAQVNDDCLFCTECGKPIPQGNVCTQCGAVLNDGDVFCQSCGKKVDKILPTELTDTTQKKCPHCGASVNDDDVFCQSCGTPLDVESQQQPTFHPTPYYDITESPTNYNKIIIPVVIGVIMLALIGGGWYFYNSKKSNGLQEIVSADSISEAVAEESFVVEEDDIHSKEFIKKRLEEICKAIYIIEEEKVVEKYFSSDFRKMYNTITTLEENGKGGDGPWYSGGFFDGSSESIDSMSVGKIYITDEDHATVDIICHSGAYKNSLHTKLVLENENWLVDDICNRQSDMKGYIDSMMNNDDEIMSQEELASTNTAIGAFDVEEKTTTDDNSKSCWFVFGTEEELMDQKILNHDNVLQTNLNKGYFTKIDSRIDKEFKLYSKEAKIITAHPSSSYTLQCDANKQYVLRITDPQLFWSTSKYLVIVVK